MKICQDGKIQQMLNGGSKKPLKMRKVFVYFIGYPGLVDP